MPSDSQLNTKICEICQAACAGAGEVHRCAHDAGGELRQQARLIGTVLDGRFQIEACLGDGGMGAIYRARHILLSKPVAIKVLRQVHDDEVTRRRFLQEARVGSCVRDDHVIGISDYGLLDDGRPYLVMELLTGRTLGDAMLEGPLLAERACGIAVQICRGLEAVHDKGIVHRDLKPDNVFLVDSDGYLGRDYVKIFDFGIAKVLSGPRLTQIGLGPLRPLPQTPLLSIPTEQFTRQGMVLGTPEYMAPEQVTGLEVDHRTDQYALGCILYEMLSGALPFNHAEVEMILRKQVVEPVIPLCERRPDLDIPPSLDALVTRALEKKRADRFPTVGVMKEALRAELRRLHRRSRVLGAQPAAPAARAVTALLEMGRAAPPVSCPKAAAPAPTVVLPAVPGPAAPTVVLPPAATIETPVVSTIVTPVVSTVVTPAAPRCRRWGPRGPGVVAAGAAVLCLLAGPAQFGPPRHTVVPTTGRAPAHATHAMSAMPVTRDRSAAVEVARAAEVSPARGAPLLPQQRQARRQPRTLTMRVRVPQPFTDGVKIACGKDPVRRCRGRCEIAVPATVSGCIASYPGYVRKRLLPQRPAEGATVPMQDVVLQACLMTPDEDCEPMALAGRPGKP